MSKKDMSRRSFLKFAGATGLLSAISFYLPETAEAESGETLLKNYFEKYGRVLVYDNVVELQKDGTMVEKYIPIVYMYKRKTQDGMMRPVFTNHNKEAHADMERINNVYPPLVNGANNEKFNQALLESKNKDFAGRNVQDFGRETAKIPLPKPNDYPCQLDNNNVVVIINATDDGKAYHILINRNAKVFASTPQQQELMQYRLKYDILKRLLPAVRAISEKLKLPFFVMERRLNRFEGMRSPEAFMQNLIMMQDPRDGVYRAINGHIQQYATDLEGKFILARDLQGNLIPDKDGKPKYLEIPGYQNAKFSDIPIVADRSGNLLLDANGKPIVGDEAARFSDSDPTIIKTTITEYLSALGNKIRREQDSRLVVCDYHQFMIQSQYNVQLLAIQGKEVGGVWVPQINIQGKLDPVIPNANDLVRFKKVVQPALDVLKRPTEPYTPLDYLPDAYFPINKTEDKSTTPAKKKTQLPAPPVLGSLIVPAKAAEKTDSQQEI